MDTTLASLVSLMLQDSMQYLCGLFKKYKHNVHYTVQIINPTIKQHSTYSDQPIVLLLYHIMTP